MNDMNDRQARDSNPQSLACKASTLPTELLGQTEEHRRTKRTQRQTKHRFGRSTGEKTNQPHGNEQPHEKLQQDNNQLAKEIEDLHQKLQEKDAQLEKWENEAGELTI